MKKHFVIFAGLLLTLGTAVAATLSSTEAQAVKPATPSEAVAKQSEQIVGLWKAHASSAASVPMARPL